MHDNEFEVPESVINASATPFEAPDRTKDTYQSSLKNWLDRVKSVGDAGMSREFVIRIPARALEENNPEATLFLKQCNEIKRNPKCNLPIKIEKTVEKYKDKKHLMLDLVFTYSNKTDIDAVNSVIK
ncbi:hypothetical protein LP048_077 [Listeria phage LP-048]|uniref:Uncharacterized protein n=2 Tax=Pecentumvirus LP048 TaxID=2560557 RepID=A0A5C2IHE4_9CAUD|nr:hypothetical protein LP048_077 [Listeria phage LP-048]AHL19750.1 hypothetical protein LP048_077 [Listeria phage LP-048]QEP53075.2 hypothetical protein FK485_0075 [Listeria phage LP-039]